jgi:hypothetical protein
MAPFTFAELERFRLKCYIRWQLFPIAFRNNHDLGIQHRVHKGPQRGTEKTGRVYYRLGQ